MSSLKHLGLALLTATALSGCAVSDINSLVANGDAVASSNVKLAAIDPAKVKIYYSNGEVPKNHKVIGHVTAEVFNIVGLKHSQATQAEHMKKQAASLGANGVMDVQSGLTQTTGTAILVK